MALALYRSYRPGTLAEVVGQPHVTNALTRALENGRVHHAYLFSGPRGCGKTSTARILARCLNCEQGPTATPCGTCRSCLELAPNGPGSMDVVELDAATHGGVDDARELREKAVYAPAASRYKVYIIDEAHQLTDAAANALLKLVEEPPAHLRFIFATTEPEKIITTIRSRTFHYGFRLVPAQELSTHLAAICAAEGIPAEPAALGLVARAGAGSVRDSLSILGQLLSAVDAAGLTYPEAAVALGVTDNALLDEFVAALAGGDVAGMFQIVDRVVGAGHDPRRFTTDVLDRLRDLMVVQADPEAVRSGLVDAPDDLAATLIEQAGSLSAAELYRSADLVSTGLSQLKGATAPRLQLELLCARLALPAADDSLPELLSRLSLLERRLATPAAQSFPDQAGPVAQAPTAVYEAPEDAHQAGIRTAPAPQSQQATAPGRPPQSGPQPQSGPGAPKPPARPAGAVRRRPEAASAPRLDAAAEAQRRPAPDTSTSPQAPAASAAVSGAVSAAVSGAAPTAGDLARIRSQWEQVLTALRSDSRVAWMGFEGSTPVSVSGGVLAVSLPDGGRIAFLTRSGHDERLRQAILSVLGMDLSVDVVLAGGPAPSRTADRPTQVSDQGQPQPGKGQGRSQRLAPEGWEPGGGPGTSGSGQSSPGHSNPTPPTRPGWDEPSPDDPDVAGGDAASGEALIARELGARKIAETEQ